MIRTALLSVSDKNGIVPFAKALHEQGIQLISTGGTAKLLAENNLPVVEVSSLTKFPEMLDGRVKTLHPMVHGGLLARRDLPEHMAALKEHGIDTIDMLVINLYPFNETVAKESCSFEDAVENIDIGGPAMLRAAAKNHQDVTVLISPEDYAPVLAEMKANKNVVSYKTNLGLAKKVFAHTAQYDGAIANYLGKITTGNEFPRTFNAQFIKKQDMRYGENPHQKAAFYIEENNNEASISTSTQLQGKELSYNNIADTDAALECVKSFTEPACVIVKHANPCGVGTADSILKAYEKAYQTDPTSAFGGIIAFNRELDEKTAQTITERQFTEVIIAPSVSEAAAKVISAKANLRLLSCGEWQDSKNASLDYKKVKGGLLVQNLDTGIINEPDLTIVSKRSPSPTEIADMLFAWKVVKFVKSNAIVYVKDQQTIGIGAGQMSRVYSARIASIKAADENLEVAGSVMASDAFFPFSDGVEAAAEAGITSVIQPGGSVNDQQVIDAVDAADMAMVFTGMRHFRH